ncbi:MAG TPA: energy transducer TonB [Bacteroidia bacterium]|nr:energy transducer TonB [Bacteroidia bacterium]
MRVSLLFYLLIHTGLLFQQSSPTDPRFEAQVIGGKAEIDQILQTQMNLPKVLVNPGFHYTFITFFALDSTGHANDIRFEGAVHQSVKAEMVRLFRFWTIRRTIDLPEEKRPYFLKFDLSSDHYKHYIKQKYKYTLKGTEKPDSSMIVYSKADRSPEFYKGGDEGLRDYLLNELEYPALAIEKSIEGTVQLEFIVEVNGYVSGIEVKKGVNGGCTEEAMRLIKESRWKPAVYHQNLVRYKMVWPITFSLRNVNRANESSNSTFGQ